jgi:hypothetical protein
MSLNQESQFNSIESLEKGWNGYGADPIPRTAIDMAREIVDEIRDARLDVFPTARESVQIECENDEGDYIEAEVYGDSSIHLFILNADGSVIERDIDREECVDRFKAFLE